MIVKATSGAMGGSKSEEFLAKADVGEDTYVRCTQLRLRRQRRGRRRSGRPSPRPYDDAPAAHAEQTPDTPTIDTLVDHLNEKFPRDDRPWAAGDTLKNVLVVLKHPDGTREPLAIGLPGDREVDQKRLEGQLEPTEVEPMDEAELAQAPRPGQGLHRPRRAGREERRRGSATSSTPASSRAPAGSPAPTSTAATCSTSWPAATSRPTAPSRPPTSATATPARTATAARWRPRAASRWATSSSSAASTPTRWTSRCSTRTASWSRSPWAPTASGPPARSPRSPRAPSTSSACAGRATSRPADVHLVAAGKDEAVFAAAERIAHELDQAGVTVLYDDRAARSAPG